MMARRCSWLTPNEYSTMTPYGAAMGMATFLGKLIRRVTGEDRRR
jgi:hypothetical protein